MKPEDKIKLTALSITKWVGSLQSIVIHTIVFILSFATVALGVFSFDRMLLVLTTILSLEAIYLSLFIQMTVNYTTETIEEVQEDVGEIQEDMGEIQEDIDEMQEDVEELQEDVEEMTEEESEEEASYVKEQRTLEQIHEGLQKLMQDVEKLQTKQ